MTYLKNFYIAGVTTMALALILSFGGNLEASSNESKSESTVVMAQTFVESTTVVVEETTEEITTQETTTLKETTTPKETTTEEMTSVEVVLCNASAPAPVTEVTVAAETTTEETTAEEISSYAREVLKQMGIEEEKASEVYEQNLKEVPKELRKDVKGDILYINQNINNEFFIVTYADGSVDEIGKGGKERGGRVILVNK